jgi:hypothetical protein
MTCLEKWKKEHPGEDPNWAINTMCPADIGINLYVDEECDGKCLDCWDQQIPGEKDLSELQKAIEKVQACVIKDSGERRQFDTGAVRDIQEGKGRCDLMPLDVVGEYLFDDLLGIIEQFKIHGTTTFLSEALNTFRGHTKMDDFTMLLEVSKHFEDGAKKYGENNWQKGIPVRCYIDSAVRHYLKWLRGDKDEPHDRAFCWNILCAIWTCKHKPELNDYKKEETEA